MGIRINGESTTYASPVAGTQSAGGGSTVHTTTGGDAPPVENVPLVGDGASETLPPAEGEVPSPTQSASGTPDPEADPAAYANYLQQQLDLQEQYQEWDAQLEELQAEGDPQAAQLRSELRKKMWSERDIEKAEEFVDNHTDMLADSDLDGDGIDNASDVDKDGDGVTAEAEAFKGTSDFATDTDGDEITDYGEMWIAQHDESLAWLDPTNADANHNGILDGRELPASITLDGSGRALTTGGTSGSEGTSGTDGVGSTSTDVRWGPASADAKQAVWGGTYEGGADVVFEGKGENVAFSESADKNDLIITNKDSGETITITGYKSTKFYLNGALGTIETENIGSGIFGGIDTDKDGYADAGIRVGSSISMSSIKTNSDYFGGAVPKIDGADGETAYNGAGASGTFTLPDSADGKVIEVKTEGKDVIITVKNSLDGEANSTIRVKNGKAAFQNGNLSFQLPDHDTYFVSNNLKVTVHGGKGNDVIIGAAGSKIYGGAGFDDLRLNGTANGGLLDGGAGDDLLQGSDGIDTLNGGEGNDGMYTGSGEGDTLNGGAGDDIGIVDNTDVHANYNVNMGGGTDMSNYTNKAAIEAQNSSINVGMYNLGGLQGAIDKLGDKATSDLVKEALDGAGDIADFAAGAAADTVKGAFLSYLMRVGGDHENAFGAGHTGGFDPQDGDVPPPAEEDENKA